MLIVVEGCVGAGKSTVARGLAGYRESETLFEAFESNPFLTAFYTDPVAYAVETEFAFLLLHFHQLKQRVARMADERELIADFYIGKDLLYADLNLPDMRARRIFGELYDVLNEEVPRPTLMICLSASTELVLQRIGERNREMELEVSPDYYAKVNAAYDEFFTLYTGRKLKLPMDDWDFVKFPDLYRRLSRLVEEQLSSP